MYNYYPQPVFTAPLWYAPVSHAAPLNQEAQARMVIRLIQEGIAGERNDELFYDYLISVAPTKQEQQVIEGIRNDERKHRKMFRSIYSQLTGREPAVTQESEQFQRPASYLEGLEMALLGELRAFEKYRTIYLNIVPQFRDMIFEIMTDEIKHAGYYNWLYAKNK